ncbi:MAG: ABC transporter ATP-binding protein, partial [Candidatus Krumholzibacteriia bacterium]
HDLSTGQRRRLALGLALGSGRPLILLDEPTAALDRDGRRMVLDMLDRAGDAAGLVIASHDRAFLAAAGCRLVELSANT